MAEMEERYEEHVEKGYGYATGLFTAFWGTGCAEAEGRGEN